MMNDTFETNSATRPVSIYRVDANEATAMADILVVEEPLEIRLDYRSENERRQKSVSITMRTPGNDDELAVGFLFTEGIIQNTQDVVEVKHCGPALAHLGHSNVVKVTLADHGTVNLKTLERNFYTTSSCGVCGKSSIDALKTQNKYSRSLPNTDFHFASELIPTLPDKLREAQAVFNSTGGLHASALFSTKGELLAVREDVGRHNALDKIIGQAFLKNQLPLSQTLLLVSGRVSFELVQKASMAGIPAIVAVGAPSSLALELAQEMKMTMIGFVRNSRFNIYTGEERVL